MLTPANIRKEMRKQAAGHLSRRPTLEPLSIAADLPSRVEHFLTTSTEVPAARPGSVSAGQLAGHVDAQSTPAATT
jgi:hypothetical protein